MRITEDLLNAIKMHGADTYPEECCGFLLGHSDSGDNHVEAIQRVTNSQEDNRERRYTITPGDYHKAQQTALQQGLDIVGFYHSHPDHPARPSQTDLQEATFPGYTYVIVSVQQGTPRDLTAWSLAPDRSRFDAEDIQMIAAST